MLPTNNHLILEQVEIGLGERKLVSLNTEVEAGQVLTVVGPSGSGKSTLLAFIAGFIAPVFSATGKVSLGDKELSHLPAEERRIGLLFQDAMLFPHMSVAQNLGFALAKTELNKKQKIEAKPYYIKLPPLNNVQQQKIEQFKRWMHQKRLSTNKELS